MLVAHMLPWDLGGAYWDTQPAEVSRPGQKIKRATPTMLTTLRAVMGSGVLSIGEEYDEVRGLNTYQETALRGHWLMSGAGKKATVLPAFPVDGFKGALMTGAKQYDGKKFGMPATKLKAVELFGSEQDQTLAHIETDDISFDETMGKDSGINKAPRHIVRIRYGMPWQTTLTVRYNAALFKVDQIVQAFEWAGDFGVGQRRPSSPHGGQYGTFRVAKG